MERELEDHPLVAGDELGARGLFSGGAALYQRRFAPAYFRPPEGSCVLHQMLGDES
jgi:hypothetical protein